MTLAPRIAIGVSILTLVSAIIGFVAVIMLNAFVFDDYDAYGEIAIPGSGSVELPEGEATISFHAVNTEHRGGLSVPDLQLSINPPDGVAEPQLTESIGGSTTINNDAHVRVWVAHIHEAGTYEVVTDGGVGGYISPRLAFGKDSSNYWLLWLFGGLVALGVAELAAALIWSAKAAKKPRPIGVQGMSPVVGYTPTDQGVRLEQLKTLTALRDSGALTAEEFEAEKRRILNS